MEERKKRERQKALQDALAAYQLSADSKRQEQVHACLKEVHLLAPVQTSALLARHMHKNTEVHAYQDANFIMVIDEENDLYYPVFSSKEAFCQFTSDQNYDGIEITLADFELLLCGQKEVRGLVIDVQSSNYKLCLEDILHITHHEHCRQVDTHMVCEIEDRNFYLTRELSQYLVQVPQVRAAYLQRMHEHQQISYLLTLDTDEFQDVSEQITDFLFPLIYETGDSVDLIAMATRFGEKLTREVKPFYERKEHLLKRILPTDFK
ncbi:hypothetical protein A4S06_06060 [Erysipelotrichaceae bacterium MTC7]|nr:hypothetical protein A4S06_06060 [Erysipelotrichaceae bacterium MTC7]